MDERLAQQAPTDLEGYLRELPALALLERLPTPMLGIGLFGEILYANRACAEMLGYPNGRAVARLKLPELLTGHEALSPAECLNTLRTAATVVKWNHHQDYMIRTMVSSSLLTQETDALLLFGVTDVTDWLWETNQMADARRAEGHGSKRTEVHGQSKRSEGHGPSRRTDGLGPW